MAPLRRYLRITPYSILEVRIYLDNPADLHRWLIHPQRPVLPDVLAAVKPLVLPKLREENARAAGKKAGYSIGGTSTSKPKGKKGVRDVIVNDSFEVSIFLTELSTPHSVLVRTRHFTAKEENAGRTGTKDAPVLVPEEEDDANAEVQLVRQETNDADNDIKLEDIPSAPDSPTIDAHNQTAGGREDDALSVSSNEDGLAEEEDEKKKLGLKTSYDGFQIYGRILCLVVKRKDQKSVIGRQRAKANSMTQPSGSSGQAGAQGQETVAEMVQRAANSSGGREEGILEGWMRSTQVGNENQGIAGGAAEYDSAEDTAEA